MPQFEELPIPPIPGAHTDRSTAQFPIEIVPPAVSGPSLPGTFPKGKNAGECDYLENCRELRC